MGCRGIQDEVTCPMCLGKKDARAQMCQPCRMIHKHPRAGSGKGWSLHEGTGYITGCFNGVSISQHRDVMEKHIGRKLYEKECVHHIDGDRTNNNIENLELMTTSEHARNHIEAHKHRMSKLGHAARWGGRE